MSSIIEGILTVTSVTAVQSALVIVLVSILVSILGFLIRRFVWAKHVVAIGIQAYEYAEEQGILKNLKAYDKFEPFMRKFIEQYYKKYAKEPSPKAKAVAVEAMEKLVLEEPLGTIGGGLSITKSIKDKFKDKFPKILRR